MVGQLLVHVLQWKSRRRALIMNDDDERLHSLSRAEVDRLVRKGLIARRRFYQHDVPWRQVQRLPSRDRHGAFSGEYEKEFRARVAMKWRSCTGLKLPGKHHNALARELRERRIEKELLLDPRGFYSGGFGRSCVSGIARGRR